MESLYETVGGEPVFRRLVERFYEGVAVDPLLRPLYPDEDLGPARDRLTKFLVQFWGGPTTYSEERGHPRLRMRHAEWVIGERERDAWLGHMRTALEELGLPAREQAMMWEHLVRTATMLVNAPGRPAT